MWLPLRVFERLASAPGIQIINPALDRIARSLQIVVRVTSIVIHVLPEKLYPRLQEVVLVVYLGSRLHDVEGAGEGHAGRDLRGLVGRHEVHVARGAPGDAMWGTELTVDVICYCFHVEMGDLAVLLTCERSKCSARRLLRFVACYFYVV